MYEYNYIFVLLLKLSKHFCVKSTEQFGKFSTLNWLSVFSVVVLERSSYFAITSPALTTPNSHKIFDKTCTFNCRKLPYVI